MRKKLFATKSIQHLQDEAQANEHGLKRALTSLNLVNLGIGAIIGAGIFVITGSAAAQYAGPGIVLSFVISGIACAFAGLCYAEFASMLPISGSAYTYAYATLGEFLAWIIGWDLVLEYLFAASTVSVGWSGYLVSFLKDFDIVIPAQLTAATNSILVNVPHIGWKPITHELTNELLKSGINIQSLPHMSAICNLPAMLVVIIVTILLIVGIKESAGFNNIMVFTKVSVIILFIGIGFAFVKMGNLHPFIPRNSSDIRDYNWSHFSFSNFFSYFFKDFGQYGFSGILRGAGVIFFAYIGFDAVSTAAQEAKNPQKDMPFGILGSLGISTVLYILVAIVLTGVVSYTKLNVSDPIAVGVDAMGNMMWLRHIIKIAALAGLSSVVLVLLMAQPRVFYSMSKDGLLPPMFSKVHSKFKTPYISSLITGVAAVVIAGTLPIDVLHQLVSIGTLFAFVIVCISIIVLRKQKPDIHRPFKTPWVPWVPILGALFCLLQMSSLPLPTWERLFVWMAIGIVIYLTYGIRKSKLRKK